MIMSESRLWQDTLKIDIYHNNRHANFLHLYVSYVWCLHACVFIVVKKF